MAERSTVLSPQDAFRWNEEMQRLFPADRQRAQAAAKVTAEFVL